MIRFQDSKIPGFQNSKIPRFQIPDSMFYSLPALLWVRDWMLHGMGKFMSWAVKILELYPSY
jgi:hypothetical protein